MIMRRLSVLLLLPIVLGALCVAPSGAVVHSGPISAMPGTTGYTWRLEWGDGVHDLWEVWSAFNPEDSGWFYGSYGRFLGRGDSNVDVYTYPGLTDPTAITDASVFTYTNQTAIAHEGDTVFFHGRNGYYGAWRIDTITPASSGQYSAVLDGQWYFQDDGSGNFSALSSHTAVGTPAVATSAWGTIKGLFR